MTDVGELIASLTREVADFPSAGIQFKDLTPVFADRRGLGAVTDALADVAAGADLIAGIDARGFLVGAAVATRLGIGMLAIRKGGKLPPPVRAESYDLEYGTATLEIPADGVVQQRGHQRGGVHAQLGEDIGDGQRVGDVGIPGMPHLVGVMALGDVIGPLQQRQVGLGVDLAVHRHQRLEHRVERAARSGHPSGQSGPHPARCAGGCLEAYPRLDRQCIGHRR